MCQSVGTSSSVQVDNEDQPVHKWSTESKLEMLGPTETNDQIEEKGHGREQRTIKIFP